MLLPTQFAEPHQPAIGPDSPNRKNPSPKFKVQARSGQTLSACPIVQFTASCHLYIHNNIYLCNNGPSVIGTVVSAKLLPKQETTQYDVTLKNKNNGITLQKTKSPLWQSSTIPMWLISNPRPSKYCSSLKHLFIEHASPKATGARPLWDWHV